MAGAYSVTANSILTVSPSPEITIIGLNLSEVVGPIFQVHVTIPLESERFSPNPSALDRPDLYSTVIV